MQILQTPLSSLPLPYAMFVCIPTAAQLLKQIFPTLTVSEQCHWTAYFIGGPFQAAKD